MIFRAASAAETHAGNYAESAEAARRALADAETSLGPESPEIGHVLARLCSIYERQGDDAEFPEMERRLAALPAKDFEVWAALGSVLRREEKFDAAEEALKKAAALSPENLDVVEDLAFVYDGMGRFEQEILMEEKLALKRPNDYVLLSRLARTYGLAGRTAEAKTTFEHARRIGRMTAGAYIAEGYVYLHSGDRARAKEDFENAVVADSASAGGYHHIAEYWFESGDAAEAEKYARQALEKLEADPNAKTDDFVHTAYMLGNILGRLGRQAEAEAVYRKCWDKPVPSYLYVACLQMLGGLYSSQNKPAQAEEAFKRSVGVCAKGRACACRGKSLIGLGSFYASHGREREAAKLAAEAETLCADDHSTWSPLVLMDLAELSMSVGDASGGNRDYDRIIPGRGSTQFFFILPRMAVLAARLGRLAEAEELYRQGIQLYGSLHNGTQEADLWDGLAAVLEKGGKRREASEAREKEAALRSAPPKPYQ